MDELRKDIESVFALARLQKATADPMNELELIHIIKLKKKLFDELDKVPQPKEKKS